MKTITKMFEVMLSKPATPTWTSTPPTTPERGQNAPTGRDVPDRDCPIRPVQLRVV